MILITGGAGYIGSHIALKLLEQGKEIIIFDSLELGSLETIETLKQYGKVKFIQGNLKNLEEVRGIFLMHKINAVIHLAAYAQVEESVKSPQKYYYNNLYGILNLLNAMLEFGSDKIIFSSTCATYGESESTPSNENYALKPINAYGNSKLMAEIILEDYSKAYNLKSVSLRYFNAVGADSKLRIGENDKLQTRLIPNILKADNEHSFKIYGNDYPTKDGTCIRDFVNIEDLADAHLKALEYLLNNGGTTVINVGSNKGHSVKEIVSLCEKVIGKTIPVEIFPRRSGDAAVLIADNSKAKNLLNWEPKTDIEQSIITEYQWLKQQGFIK